MNEPSPLYIVSDIRSAYQLRYAWTAWPKNSQFPEKPQIDILDDLLSAWESDGIRCLELTWSRENLQALVSTKPHIAPVSIASRLKGRLKHALREAGWPSAFSRKFSLRSIGDNRSTDIDRYIANQVKRAQLVDPNFEKLLSRFTRMNSEVNWRQPIRTNRGCYWYDFHLVLVTDDRLRFYDERTFELLDEYCSTIAAARGHRIGCQSIMPDHLHLALRGNPKLSPQAIALSFLNNLAFLLGQKRVWQDGFYVGTFSEYNINAIRRRLS